MYGHRQTKSLHCNIDYYNSSNQYYCYNHYDNYYYYCDYDYFWLLFSQVIFRAAIQLKILIAINRAIKICNCD